MTVVGIASGALPIPDTMYVQSPMSWLESVISPSILSPTLVDECQISNVAVLLAFTTGLFSTIPNRMASEERTVSSMSVSTGFSIVISEVVFLPMGHWIVGSTMGSDLSAESLSLYQNSPNSGLKKRIAPCDSPATRGAKINL